MVACFSDEALNESDDSRNLRCVSLFRRRHLARSSGTWVCSGSASRKHHRPGDFLVTYQGVPSKINPLECSDLFFVRDRNPIRPWNGPGAPIQPTMVGQSVVASAASEPGRTSSRPRHQLPDPIFLASQVGRLSALSAVLWVFPIFRCISLYTNSRQGTTRKPKNKHLRARRRRQSVWRWLTASAC